MSFKIANFDEAVSTLKTYLPKYLQDQGIDTSKVFKCINPAHEDKRPSMRLYADKAIPDLFCFSCGSSADLFSAAHFLEGRAISGGAFITDNLKPLAEKYGVELKLDELTEEELYELDTYRAYRIAADYIKSTTNRSDLVKEAIKERGWTDEVLSIHRVGSVPSFHDFREMLKNHGFSAVFLDEIDLGRRDLFNEENLIFTVSDEHGRPVGFAARNLKYEEHLATAEANGDKLNEGKYVNQRTTGLRCNIYQKGKRLYGLDIAKTQNLPVWIMEGYADVITARQHGFLNCVAIGGTAFTAEHVLTLKENGIYDICLMLDADKAGIDKTARLLDERFSGHRDLKVSVAMLPTQKDPDEFIRANGIEAFRGLKRWSAFEWRLNRYPEDAAPEDIAKTMIPFIVNESSYIAQEQMCNILATHTGFSLRAIQAELARLQNEKNGKKQREKDLIIQRVTRDVQTNPDDAEVVLQAGINKLQEIAKKYDNDSFSEDAFLKIIEDGKVSEEQKSAEYAGFRLGSDLQMLEDALSGNWRKDVLLILGGSENAGKSSLCRKIGFEIANYPENNALVIYHTIDDSLQQLLPGFITIAEGTRKLEMNHVVNPNYWTTRGIDNIQQRREAGYQRVMSLGREGRLIIKDENSGATLAYAEALIKYYKNKYPDRNILYILDNFHKLKDFQSMGVEGNERVRYKIMSNLLKSIAVRHHIAVLATMEYTKLAPGQRPTNHNIAESVQMSYDANLIAHVYNEMHHYGEKAELFHTVTSTDGNIVPLPTIELSIGKNKISSFKNKLYFDFFPTSSDFIGRIYEPSIDSGEETVGKALTSSLFAPTSKQKGNGVAIHRS